MKMKIKEANNTGPCGEYYVLAQLLRLEYQAFLAQGANQKDWDIIVSTEVNDNIKIQVKTIDWRFKNRTINGKFHEPGFDILIIVILYYKDKMTDSIAKDFSYLIMKKGQLKEKKDDESSLFIKNKEVYYSRLNPDRQDNNQSITLTNLEEEHFVRFSDWGIIK